MAGPEDEKKRHFILDGMAEAERFRSPQQGGGGRAHVPERNRPQHGGALQSRIATLKDEASAARQRQAAAGLDEGFGLQVEFESFPDIELAFESLARENQGIDLLNVRHDEHTTYATVFVPDGKLDHFERLIREYLEHKTDINGNPRDNRPLIDAIREVRAASLRALWTDDGDVFPQDDAETLWWEVWLPVRKGRQGVVARFRQMAEGAGMRIAPGDVEFPERTILLVYASVAQMKASMLTLNSIAELRRAKETADFFESLPPVEQREWVDEALGRTEFSNEHADVPHVCLIDTGINRGHPLLGPALAADDLHTVEPGWGVDDEHGHGTSMAGLALFGDITELLEDASLLRLDHRLESVKLLRADGGNASSARW